MNSSVNYNATYKDGSDGRLILHKTTCNRMQQLMAVHNIVLLSQRGKLIYSTNKKIIHLEVDIVSFGIFAKGFLKSEFDKFFVENIDETHVLINCDHYRDFGVLWR